MASPGIPESGTPAAVSRNTQHNGIELHAGRACTRPLTGDGERYGHLRLAELVAQDQSVVAAVRHLRVEDRQARPVNLTDLGAKLRLESLALLDQNAFSVPEDLQR